MCSCLPTLLSDAQGSLVSVWVVFEDWASSAKVWLTYHVTKVGSQEVPGSGLERCSCSEWLMCSCLPTLPRHAQGSLMSVRIVPEDRSTSAEVVVEIPRYTGWVSGLRGVRTWSGVEKGSCRG